MVIDLIAQTGVSHLIERRRVIQAPCAPITRAHTGLRPASRHAPRSRAPRSPRLGSWPPCPACRNTGARRRPIVGPAWGNWSHRESARRCVRESWRAAGATRVRRLRRIGDEVLKGLIGARTADALQHRAHGLAPAVAQQAKQVPAKRATLRDVREATLERREPFAQPVEPRWRVARQSRQHRAAAYRSPVTSTRPLISIHIRSRSESADLTK